MDAFVEAAGYGTHVNCKCEMEAQFLHMIYIHDRSRLILITIFCYVDQENRNSSGKYFIRHAIFGEDVWMCQYQSSFVPYFLWICMRKCSCEFDKYLKLIPLYQYFLTQSFYIYHIEILTAYLTHAEIMLICELGHAGKLSITLINKFTRKKRTVLVFDIIETNNCFSVSFH